MKHAVLILALITGWRAAAQLPQTDIFLARIQLKNNLLKISKTENITGRKGYDNQPFFSPDGKIIYYSAQAEDNRVHINAYNIRSKKSVQVTRTNTSEYSPMLTPAGTISCVVVEEDSTQRIWHFDAKSGERKGCLTENTDSVGYYAWLGKDSILYYKLTDPHSLRVFDLKTAEDNWLCDKPARSFRRVDKRTMFYVIREEKQNIVMLYDLLLKKATLHATDVRGNEDYVWLPGTGLVKSEGAKLLRYSADTKVWVELADFTGAGIKKISRFAFSPDQKYLSLVSHTE